MNYSIKQLSHLLILLLILTANVFAQDSLNVSGVVLYPVAETEGDLITPETPSPTPFDNIKVSQDLTNQMQVEVSVDINPQNPNNIVASWVDYRETGFTKVAYGYSFDGGLSWSDGTLPLYIGGYLYQGDPAVAVNKNGIFFISFISYTSLDEGGVFIAKSTDGGITWPSIVRLDADNIFDDKPYIAIDKTNSETANNIYVAWDHKWVAEGNEVHFARSTDHGSTFQRQSINSISRKWQLGAMPAVDQNGNVYVVWMGQELGIIDPHHRNFYLTKSTDGGEIFGSDNVIITVNAFVWPNGINLIKRLYPFPIIATNPVLSGHIYITWSNKVVGLGGSNPDSSDVLFMRSTDYGETWSSPINIINNGLDPSPILNDQFFPWIAVDPTGEKISIMYYNRSEFPNNDYMHVNL